MANNKTMQESQVLLMLEDILDKNNELCNVCEFYGQVQSKCPYLRNSECAKHILELFKSFQERMKIES